MEEIETCQLPNNFRIVDHTDGGKCLLDTTTFEYYRIPDLTNKSKIGGKFYYTFDTIEDFLDSDANIAIIPVFCKTITKKKKRYFVSVISGNDVYDKYNVERINNEWVHNLIDMVPGSAYFIFAEKNEHADSGFLINRSKKIER